MRDDQRNAFRSAVDASGVVGRKFATPDEAQVYLDERVRSRWFRRRFGSAAELGVVVKPLELAAGTGEGWAWEDISRRRVRFKTALFPILLLPASRLDEATVWHLVAHAVGPSAEPQAHGREFVRRFLLLVDKFLGAAAGKALRREFDARGVRRRARPRLSAEELERRRARGRALAEAGRLRRTGDGR